MVGIQVYKKKFSEFLRKYAMTSAVSARSVIPFWNFYRDDYSGSSPIKNLIDHDMPIFSN